MIQANELRIGDNLLLNDDVICTIKEIRNNFLRVSYLREDVNKEHTSLVEFYRFKPIPLTEEILLKCGFEKKYKSYKKGDFMFLQSGYDELAYKL